MKYDHKKIEAKWQKRWEKEKQNIVDEDAEKKKDKMYILDMFPYPSADGLHVGHVEGYTATDILSRYNRLRGKYVLHPIGWDAFGLPAENFAIKKGVHPKETTENAIKNFTRQIKSLGFSYDWSREINTSSPEYYRWTQWLFLLLYKNGLAYKDEAPVNWCKHCQTVLANEQVIDGKCERCKNEVAQKELTQWFFRITKYADRLLADLEKLDWPERIKEMQKNWIGRSEGAEINFRVVATEGVDSKNHASTKIKTKEIDIPVFTTRPDTLFGASYIVLSPEHSLVPVLTSEVERKEAQRYVRAAKKKNELERTGTEREKTGVPLGTAAIHPLTGEKIPIWIADYVLMGYGTGAVMGVPGHDERDFSFAKKYGLDIKYVIAPPHEVSEARHEEIHHSKNPKSEIRNPKQLQNSKFQIPNYLGAYTGAGFLVNSEEFNGLTSEDAKKKITDALISKNLGRRQVNYHLRDWLISRQRYWGAPIPIIYCEKCGEVPVPEEDLPALLPDDVDFRPTGESPLTRSKKFHNVKCPVCLGKAKRESDTMDTFVDSSWYFLRYCDPQNERQFAIGDKLKYWCPVDLYVGGAEHAVLHLLYARFFTKVLSDLKYISFDEPFTSLRNQGLIMGPDGQKMSKSRGNVINPDEVVTRFGADSIRMYEMFMGDFTESKPWDTNGITGIRRFLERVWNFTTMPAKKDAPEVLKLLHKTIKKVTEDIEALKFNTAISAMMIFGNKVIETQSITKESLEKFLIILAPFAPHIAEEVWEELEHKESVFKEKWPEFDAALTKDDQITLVAQVNGKVRDTLSVAAGISDANAKLAAMQSEKVKKWLEGKEIKQAVVVSGRLVNIVTD
ncbi:leucine--tRNA ligase [Candidatus Uhrbacteria bacterium]|nr:leucine--tRNA ligase [Candidatus Uhrbacteria bacterium]